MPLSFNKDGTTILGIVPSTSISSYLLTCTYVVWLASPVVTRVRLLMGVGEGGRVVQWRLMKSKPYCAMLIEWFYLSRIIRIFNEDLIVTMNSREPTVTITLQEGLCTCKYMYINEVVPYPSSLIQPFLEPRPSWLKEIIALKWAICIAQQQYWSQWISTLEYIESGSVSTFHLLPPHTKVILNIQSHKRQIKNKTKHNRQANEYNRMP